MKRNPLMSNNRALSNESLCSTSHLEASTHTTKASRRKRNKFMWIPHWNSVSEGWRQLTWFITAKMHHRTIYTANLFKVSLEGQNSVHNIKPNRRNQMSFLILSIYPLHTEIDVWAPEVHIWRVSMDHVLRTIIQFVRCLILYRNESMLRHNMRCTSNKFFILCTMGLSIFLASIVIPLRLKDRITLNTLSQST